MMLESTGWTSLGLSLLIKKMEGFNSMTFISVNYLIL